MKPTLLFVTLAMICASSGASSKSELETLRARCAEQERQIAQLEQNNSNSPHALGSSNELISTKAAKPAEISKVSEARPPAAKSDNAVYTVKAGDSIEKIANTVKSTPSTLAKLNGMKANAIIHPGQQLKVPGTVAATAKSETRVLSKAPDATVSNVRKKYTVQDNDTFSSISRKQKISVASLIAANPSVKPTALHTGQVINLGTSKSAIAAAPPSVPTPVAKASTPAPTMQVAKAKTKTPESFTPPSATKPVNALASSASAKPEPAPAAPATAAPENTSPNPDKKIHPVTIDGDLTYGEFATQYGTSPERLNALNGLDLTHATVLAKGSELYVPAQP